MKKWFQHLQKQEPVIDEHSLPTEPLPPLDPQAPLVLPAMPQYPAQAGDVVDVTNVPTLPSAQPVGSSAIAAPSPGMATPVSSGGQWPPYQFPTIPSPASVVPTPPYPAVPPQIPQQDPTWLQPNVGQRLTNMRQSSSRSIPIPLIVGLCFVTIQLLLVARLIVLFLPGGTTSAWSATIIALGDLCAEPCFALIQQAGLPAPVNVAVAVLLAIFGYGILSRMLVRLLKILLHRQRASTV
jgi:hypothetical protein